MENLLPNFRLSPAPVVLLAIQVVLSPRNLAVTGLPFSPMTLTVWGSPGTRSRAWSPHLTSSPSTSSTMPLIGRWALSTIASPCSSGVILRPRFFTSGNRINLNGSGLTKKFCAINDCLAACQSGRKPCSSDLLHPPIRVPPQYSAFRV